MTTKQGYIYDAKGEILTQITQQNTDGIVKEIQHLKPIIERGVMARVRNEEMIPLMRIPTTLLGKLLTQRGKNMQDFMADEDLKAEILKEISNDYPVFRFQDKFKI
jgi:hypothetical protein